MSFYSDTDVQEREIERTYEVTFADRKVIARLRYTPGDEPAERVGDDAIAEAVKRAQRIRDRKNWGKADAMSVDVLREQLVDARPKG